MVLGTNQVWYFPDSLSHVVFIHIDRSSVLVYKHKMNYPDELASTAWSILVMVLHGNKSCLIFPWQFVIYLYIHLRLSICQSYSVYLLLVINTDSNFLIDRYIVFLGVSILSVAGEMNQKISITFLQSKKLAHWHCHSVYCGFRLSVSGHPFPFIVWPMKSLRF
jgi:hypothetical protein